MEDSKERSEEINTKKAEDDDQIEEINTEEDDENLMSEDL